MADARDAAPERAAAWLVPVVRGTLALVENALRLLMWTVVALFTLLLVVVIALG